MSFYRYSQKQPDAPKPSESPLEALTHKVTDSNQIWDEYAGPLLGSFVGIIHNLWTNHRDVRPLFSNIPKFILLMGFYSAFFEAGQRFRIYRQAEKEAIAREYVELHPEDFPPYERKKFKDIFMDWTPIR